MAASGGIYAPIALRILRKAVHDASKVVRNKISTFTKSIHSQTVNAPVRPSGSRSLRQQRRLFSQWQTAQQNVDTSVRRFLSTVAEGEAAKVPRFDRLKFPVSQTSRALSQLPGRAPFAHTLRPNLTGGALPRSAGGYGTTGGGARYFSHIPAAPAQVVQNVSQAIRAFLLQGKRARFDGVDAHGHKRYRTVSTLEYDIAGKASYMPRFTPGSFVDFSLSPTITAMSPLAAAFPYAGPKSVEKEFLDDEFVPTAHTYFARVQHEHITTKAVPTTLLAVGFLDELATDISRALKDLSAIMRDIRRLSSLGDLSVELVPDSNIPTIRVRFPGIDVATVEALCDDLDVTRGLVGQDPGFDISMGISVALKFPFAPDCDGNTKTLISPRGSDRSLKAHELEEEFDYMSEADEVFMLDELSDHHWISTLEPEGYNSLSSEDFEGVEGIYHFIEECDQAKGHLRFLG